ncbi:MAG: oligosaccharide flippase family protein [Geminicoccaceae bacterium]|nr:oligosaccharide flippase family protein [Geminicoccaceae bacterium]
MRDRPAGGEVRPLHPRPGGFAPTEVLRGGVWRFVEIAGGEGLTFLFTLLTARLLAPEDFGVVAVATLTVTVATFVVRQGVSEALIRQPELTERHVHTAFVANLALGALMALSVAILARPIAVVAHKPLLEPALLVLAPQCLLAAVTFVGVGLLRRRLDYRGLALRSLIGTVVGYGVVIPLALHGWGAWSMILGQLANGIASVIVILSSAGYRPQLDFGRKQARALARTAVPIAGYALPNLVGTAAVLALGLWLPAELVGAFYVAERLLQAFFMLSGGSIADLALPVLARLAGSAADATTAFRRAFQLSAAVCLPVFCGLALFADALVPLLFGAQWTAAIAPTRILALSGLVASFTALAAQVLIAVGQPRAALLAHTATVVPGAIALASLAPWGLVPALLGRALAQCTGLVAGARLLETRAGLAPATLLRDLSGPAAATAVLALLLLGLRPFGVDLPPLARLALGGAIGAAAYGGALWFCDRALFRALASFVAQKGPPAG